ncbi:MAG TPA: hypothetical protein VM164_01010 [Burkholderiales bacterium]|nr:hypothetical protein [Burkholderiales bacterium]
MSSVVQGARKVIFPDVEVDAIELRGDVTYLRVVLGRHVALMGLLALEPHVNGQVEVWIGAGGEVLRLQKGRVIGASGFPTEWRQVVLPAFPAWAAVAQATQSYEWARVRDVMPGYRSAVRDQLVLRSIAVPNRSAIRGYNPETLSWFEERAHPGREASPDLQTARYAVENDAGIETVVYAEQCLSRDVCFTWQHWYVALQHAARTASRR